MISQEQNESFQRMLAAEKGQFNVHQIRPSLARAYTSGNAALEKSDLDISLLGFDVICLVRYIILLEERLESLGEQRQSPDVASQEWMTYQKNEIIKAFDDFILGR